MEMNSYERCMAAIQGKPVDRIPADLHNFLMCAEASGMKYSDYMRDSEKMAEMHIKLWEQYGHDMLLIENGTATLAEALGAGVLYQEHAAPVAHTPAFKDLAAVKKLEITEKFWESPLLKAQLETVERLTGYFQERVFIIGRGDQGPFSLAAQLYGMDRLLMDLLDEDMQEEVESLLEFCTQACILLHRKLISLGAHMTSMGDSTAGPDVISPAMYRTFAMPCEKKVIDAVHKAGGKISLHICGNASAIIEEMSGLGADVLEIDQKTDFMAAREKTAGKCALLGQVDPGLMRNGTVQEVREASEKIIREAGGKHAAGLILGPGCALAGDTPKENVLALVQSTKIF